MFRKMWFVLMIACLLVSAAYAETANTLELPANLKIIKEEAYYQAESIGEVIIPEGVTEIGPRAFAYSGLTKINLPATLVDIAPDAFEGCGYFTAQVVSGTAAYDFCTNNGIDMEVTDVWTPISDFEYGYSWEYNEYGGILESVHITGYTGTSPVVRIPFHIEGKPVTAISSNTFNGNSDIQTVIFPDTITDIYDRAFVGCANLTSVYFPAELESIRDSAFEGCTSLRLVDFPEACFYYAEDQYGYGNGDLEIWGAAFKDCDSLESVSIRRSMNYGSVNPYSPASIDLGNSCFEGCDNLKSVELIYDCTSSAGWHKTSIRLRDSVFKNCKNLRSLALSEDVGTVDVGVSAFENCVSLETFPVYADSVGDFAFKGCTNLKSVNIGSYIGESAFEGCTSLTSAQSDIESISFGDDYAYGSIGKNAFAGCVNLTGNMVYDGIDEIGEGAFSGCSGIEYIILPNTCTVIGENAFTGCNLRATVYAGSPAEAYMQANNIPCDVVNDPFRISIMEDYTCSVEYYGGDLWNIVVPERFGPYTVTKLGYELFDYGYETHEKYNTLTLPDTITEIEYEALGSNNYIIRPTLIFHANSSTFYTIYNYCNRDSVSWDLCFCSPSCPSFLLTSGSQNGIDVLYVYDYIGEDTVVTIPNEIDGMAVAKVISNNSNAWSGVTDLYIEPNISFGWRAFNGCDTLVNVTCLGDVPEIFYSAFYDCPALRTITFNGSADIISSVGGSVFSECDSLTNLILPSGNPTLGESSFAYANLRTITIPDDWTTLPTKVFYQTTLPDKVMIPNSITSIADNAFGSIYSWDDTPVIYCNEYSYAQTWANSKGLPVVLMNGQTFTDYGCVIVPETLSISAGTETTIEAQVFPYDAALTPEWSSSAPEIVSVDQNGKITTHAQGEAVITVSAGGVSSEIAVSVYLPVTDFTLSDTEITVDAGATAQLSIQSFTPAESSASFLWTTDNDLMATVDETGLVSALSLGDVIITCTAENGLSRSCTVHVVAPE